MLRITFMLRECALTRDTGQEKRTAQEICAVRFGEAVFF